MTTIYNKIHVLSLAELLTYCTEVIAMSHTIAEDIIRITQEACIVSNFGGTVEEMQSTINVIKHAPVNHKPEN